MRVSSIVDSAIDASAEHPELRLLFHRLNNQLGIILAHAELLEAKSEDEVNRARASQVVTSVLEAMGTARAIREQPRGESAASPYEARR
jgi:hypothetical protein